jgi:hypothetical protein
VEAHHNRIIHKDCSYHILLHPQYDHFIHKDYHYKVPYWDHDYDRSDYDSRHDYNRSDYGWCDYDSGNDHDRCNHYD